MAGVVDEDRQGSVASGVPAGGGGAAGDVNAAGGGHVHRALNRCPQRKRCVEAAASAVAALRATGRVAVVEIRGDAAGRRRVGRGDVDDAVEGGAHEGTAGRRSGGAEERAKLARCCVAEGFLEGVEVEVDRQDVGVAAVGDFAVDVAGVVVDVVGVVAAAGVELGIAVAKATAGGGDEAGRARRVIHAGGAGVDVGGRIAQRECVEHAAEGGGSAGGEVFAEALRGATGVAAAGRVLFDATGAQCARAGSPHRRRFAGRRIAKEAAVADDRALSHGWRRRRRRVVVGERVRARQVAVVAEALGHPTRPAERGHGGEVVLADGDAGDEISGSAGGVAACVIRPDGHARPEIRVGRPAQVPDAVDDADVALLGELLATDVDSIGDTNRIDEQPRVGDVDAGHGVGVVDQVVRGVEAALHERRAGHRQLQARHAVGAVLGVAVAVVAHSVLGPARVRPAKGGEVGGVGEVGIQAVGDGGGAGGAVAEFGAGAVHAAQVAGRGDALDEQGARGVDGEVAIGVHATPGAHGRARVPVRVLAVAEEEELEHRDLAEGDRLPRAAGEARGRALCSQADRDDVLPRIHALKGPVRQRCHGAAGADTRRAENAAAADAVGVDDARRCQRGDGEFSEDESGGHDSRQRRQGRSRRQRCEAGGRRRGGHAGAAGRG